MKECDILGVKTFSDPSYIFYGVGPPNPQDLRPCCKKTFTSEQGKVSAERTRSTLTRCVSVKSTVMSFQVLEWSRLNSCTTSNTDPLLATFSLSSATYIDSRPRLVLQRYCTAGCTQIHALGYAVLVSDLHQNASQCLDTILVGRHPACKNPAWAIHKRSTFEIWRPLCVGEGRGLVQYAVIAGKTGRSIKNRISSSTCFKAPFRHDFRWKTAWGIKRWCASDICLSVAYIGPKSRTEEY